MIELKHWLNSINHEKNDLLSHDPNAIDSYPPYIVNRCLSGFLDTLMFVNEINMHPFLDKRLQYYFLLNTIRPRKRFAPWIKQERLSDLDAIKKYYGYSNEKARQALRILRQDQIIFIKNKLNPGGKNVESGRTGS